MVFSLKSSFYASVLYSTFLPGFSAFLWACLFAGNFRLDRHAGHVYVDLYNLEVVGYDAFEAQQSQLEEEGKTSSWFYFGDKATTTSTTTTSTAGRRRTRTFSEDEDIVDRVLLWLSYFMHGVIGLIEWIFLMASEYTPVRTFFILWAVLALRTFLVKVRGPYQVSALYGLFAVTGSLVNDYVDGKLDFVEDGDILRIEFHPRDFETSMLRPLTRSGKVRREIWFRCLRAYLRFFDWLHTKFPNILASGVKFVTFFFYVKWRQQALLLISVLLPFVFLSSSIYGVAMLLHLSIRWIYEQAYVIDLSRSLPYPSRRLKCEAFSILKHSVKVAFLSLLLTWDVYRFLPCIFLVVVLEIHVLCLQDAGQFQRNVIGSKPTQAAEASLSDAIKMNAAGDPASRQLAICALHHMPYAWRKRLFVSSRPLLSKFFSVVKDELIPEFTGLIRDEDFWEMKMRWTETRCAIRALADYTVQSKELDTIGRLVELPLNTLCNLYYVTTAKLVAYEKLVLQSKQYFDRVEMEKNEPLACNPMFLLHDFVPLLDDVVTEVRLALHQVVATFNVTTKMWPVVHRDLFAILKNEQVLQKRVRIEEEGVVIKKLLVKYMVETQGLTRQQLSDKQQAELKELYLDEIFFLKQQLSSAQGRFEASTGAKTMSFQEYKLNKRR